MTVYEQLGGEPGVSALVIDFYRRISTDDLLAPWFVRVDGDSLRSHFRAYFAVAFGGPENYSGRSMQVAHSGLGISNEAFDTVLERLTDSLNALGVAPTLIRTVKKRVSALRPFITEPLKG